MSVARTVTGAMSSVPLESIVFVTAYDVTSEYISGGLCITTTGSSIPVSSEMSIAKPADANSTAFELSVTSLFQDYLGFSTCAVQLVTNLTQVAKFTSISLSVTTGDLLASTQVVNGATTPFQTITADPLLSTTLVSSASKIDSSSPTTSSAGEDISSGFTAKDKAATGVVISVVATISLVLGILFYLRRQRKRSNSGKDTYKSEEEIQPYLQQKAELDAEEKRRLELEAVEVRYEMDGSDHRNEMPAQGSEVGNEVDTIERSALSSLRERHELRGEEHSKELEAP